MSVGVVIARLQAPNITIAQKKLLEEASKNNHLLVLIGVPRLLSTKKNSLDFATRKMMVESLFPKAICLPIYDMWSDKHWSKQVDKLILSMFFFDKNIKLYHGRDSFKKHYEGSLPTYEVETIAHVNATSFREAVTVENSEDFRKGVIYSVYNQPPRIVSCVDILLYKFIGGKLYFLGGLKEDYEFILMPGGHVDIGDKDIWAAGGRELYEETKVGYNYDYFRKNAKIITQRYINSFRNTEDAKLWTTLLAMEVKDLEEIPLFAGDDLTSVDIFCYEDNVDRIDPEHRTLIQEFLDEHNSQN